LLVVEVGILNENKAHATCTKLHAMFANYTTLGML
jgi:hypothetical protein